MENNLVQQQPKSMFSSYNDPTMKDGFLYDWSLSSSNQIDFQYFDAQIHLNSNGSPSLNPMYNEVNQTSSTIALNFHNNYEHNPFVQNDGHVQVMSNPFLPHHTQNPIEIMGSNQSQTHLNKKPFKKNTVKGKWTIEEDILLTQLVHKYGETKWSQISQLLSGRIGGQCRPRWMNHLRPHIKKDAWSEEEDKVLIQAHKEMGNKWEEFEKILPGRTENSIKNH
ncbi:transcription factor MYB98-like [Euphorbia lathyris]|uniref:transcription factor MYB98-like n=1 Tax=Euphorbia lathyris TaxID=212925 RepID=UPI003313E828